VLLLFFLFEENTSRLASGSKEEKFEKRMVFHKTKNRISSIEYLGALPRGSFIKQLKPHPVAIVGTLILLAGVIIYSVTVKKNVEVQIPDYFIFKATD